MTNPIEPTESSKILRQEQEEAQKISLSQESSELNMTEFADEAAFNPIMMARRFETLEQKISRKSREEKPEKAEQKVARIEKAEEVSEEFERKNPELEARSLQLLRSRISSRDTADKILEIVQDSYPDPALADEAFEYLEQTSTGDLLERIREAKQKLNDRFSREIRAGRNMGTQSRAFAAEGLGSPLGLRTLYRDITGNPREVTDLFSELFEKFTYDKMEKAIDFLLSSMGADLKSKGPSIARGELHRLMTEARNLLAILWVYRFFRGRMNLITSAFERSGRLLPYLITFELLAKLFMQLLKERYPSQDKILQLALKLGISPDLLAQIIIFTQMRDAVRGVAPKLFRSEQHRHDVLMCFIEALEDLEKRVEEEEEK